MSLARRLADTATIRAWLPHIPAHVQISIGLAGGTLVGLAANMLAPQAPWVSFLATHVTRPIGGLFLRLLFVLILPLLFSSVIGGIAGVRDLGTLRRLAMRACGYMIVATALAVLIGLAAVNLFRPGDGIDRGMAHQLLVSAKGARSIVEAGGNAPMGLIALVDLMPFNVLGTASQDNLIGVIFFALLFGIGLVLVRTEATRQIVTMIEGLFQVGMRLFDIVIRFAPIAVACFMFDLTVMFGWSLLAHLGAYVGVVLLALVLHVAIIFSAIVWIGGGMSPTTFFRGVQEAAFIAFSTASSHAALPTSLRVAEDRLHLPPELARFVLGIGTSVNQNGTAIYQAVTVVFLAQALGVQLALSQQLSVFIFCMLGGIGTAGIPAGSLPVVAMVLALVGIPPEAIGLVLGVDRILDMCRTMLNVIGDLAIAVAVAHER